MMRVAYIYAPVKGEIYGDDRTGMLIDFWDYFGREIGDEVRKHKRALRRIAGRGEVCITCWWDTYNPALFSIFDSHVAEKTHFVQCGFHRRPRSRWYPKSEGGRRLIVHEHIKPESLENVVDKLRTEGATHISMVCGGVGGIKWTETRV